MRRPLGFVALLYGGGLILANFFQPPLLLLFSVSLLLAGLALVFGRTRSWLLVPLIVFSGWTNLVCRTAIVSPVDLRATLSEAPEDVVLRGTLLETPSERISLRDETESVRTLAELSVKAVKRNDQWQAAVGKIIVVTPGTLPADYFSGQKVEVTGIIAPPDPPLADGLFDYQTYLRRQSIYFQMKAPSPSEWHLLSTNRTPPLSDRFRSWAKATLARGLPVEDKPLRLMWAMTLGSKNVLTSEAYEPFVESGTMHIFAISGLHIALIAGILVKLLQALRVSRTWCGALVIPLIWFYTAATGWQPSAIRSTLMMSIIIAGWSLKRPSDLLNSLSVAALVILIWEPQQLFQASFQLSFFVVLSIALFLPPLEKLRDRLLSPDPMLPKEMIPRWQRWLAQPLRCLATALATSIAAWLGSWPLTVYYFHLFSPVTLLANLLIVPASSAALCCNLGSLVCGDWLPFATELFNHSGWFWMNLMMQISEWATRLPGAFFYAPSPMLADFGIYYGSLLAMLTGFVWNPRRRMWVSGGAMFIAAFYLWRWQEARTSTELTVVPLNGASAIYCDAPGTRNDLLVDCGNDHSVEFVVKPFLRSRGVNRLSRLALTHGDLKCVGGTEQLQTLIPTRQIITSPAPFRSAVYRSIIKKLQTVPERWLKVRAGDCFGQWTALYPSEAAAFPQADDNALVLRGEINGTRILLLSELGRAGQEALLASGVDLRADIVIAGLPAKGEPLNAGLLEAIAPRLIVIADSEYPVLKRATPALRERLAQTGIPVLYTRNAGAVTLHFRNSNPPSIQRGETPGKELALSER
ncbi:MAG: ComEC/Rec2 family competence protein [Verrucomicrobiota bacterium]